MKSAAFLSSILLVCLAYSAYAQEYSYTHYDITDGLAGSVVYCITQDRDGFIWVGTETGVSRFDGTHFKTFTPADGLPDIEVLKMFTDSKGRVWMAPFKTSVCYYYQGKIHNQDNDPFLSRIHLKENVADFAEDTSGNILLVEKNALHWFGADGSIVQIDSIAGRPVRNAVAVSRSSSGRFLVEADGSVYTLNGKNSQLIYTFHFATQVPIFLWMGPNWFIWRDEPTIARIHFFATGRTIDLPFEWYTSKHLSFGGSGDSLYFINELTGSKEYNLHTGATRVYLPGKAVSSRFRDAGGNTWFTTLGSGIYRLNSDEFRSIRINEPGMDESGIYSITRIGDLLLAGTNINSIFAYSLPDMRAQPKSDMIGFKNRDRILVLQPLNENTLLLGTDIRVGIARIGQSFNKTCIIPEGIKAIFKMNTHEYLLSAIWGVGILDLNKRCITDTLWRERSTTVYCQSDTVYIGTLNGLYRQGPDRKPEFMGKTNRFFTKRISSMAESADGTLWIASYDAGLVGYRNGAIVATIDKRAGLSSDVCRTIRVHKNVLWVGTDKGLNRIALEKKGYPIIRYTSNDGLGSDMINCIYTDSDAVYVGTSTGLSFFDQTRVDVSQKCRLHLLSIYNSGEDRIGDSVNLQIPYRDKHVRFEFAAISYRSVSDIVYRYRMLGLDSTWQETKETFLEYPILPSGKYVFQLQATNKFGVKSDLLSLRVEVATPWWQTVWFEALLIAAFLGLVWLLATRRIKRIHRRQEEKERLDQRMAELENTALQAQMNPHFIFNCLNSIQQYVFDHDIAATNKYLAGFARLIRATLQNSSRTFIPLTDEIDYLSTYLSLEKLRFKDRMEYTIEVDPAIEKDIFLIPPMLIQPFVENSMRHGLRHKTHGQGYIHLRFGFSESKLLVIVEDNGIGRSKSAAYKTREHIEYQSKGMSLTVDRMRMMNAKFGDGITIGVEDLEAGEGLPVGTRVTLHFPLFHILITQNDVV